VPVNTDLPVQTAWDIGVDDAMAIWCFQVYPDHLDIVDYYEGYGQGFDHYCERLDKRGYRGTDWYPHDVKVREVGSPGARTRIETLMFGTNCQITALGCDSSSDLVPCMSRVVKRSAAQVVKAGPSRRGLTRLSLITSAASALLPLILANPAYASLDILPTFESR
jgi:hypothetical protein